MESIDRALSKNLRAGTSAAWVALLKSQGEDLYSYLLSLCENKAGAEDLLQETFMISYRKRNELSDAKWLRAWLFKTARSVAYNWNRKERRRVLAEKSFFLFRFGSGGDMGGHLADMDEETLAVQKTLSSLPLEQSEVFNLHVFQDLTFEEIASVTDTGTNTVAARYRYACEKLKLLMRKDT